MQILHGGRQVLEVLNPNPVSASNIQLKPVYGMTFAKPTALTKEGIDDVVNQVALSLDHINNNDKKAITFSNI